MTSTGELRIALLGDLHGNLPALEAVLAHLDGGPPFHAVYHVGDLVGYAPWPNEVVRLLDERGIAGVAGNYDSTVAAGHAHCGCRYEDPRQEETSHSSYAWTREHVTEETRRRLGALPFRMDVRPRGGHASGPTLTLIHGNAVLNTVYWTEDRDDDFCRKMAARLGAAAGDVIAFGHTHLPWHRTVDGVVFVNTGSVGRPKDGDPRACYAVLRIRDEGTVAEFVRVPYDIPRASEAIRRSELPDEFAEFLSRGGKPAPTP
ncbi:MAG: metallophosphatase family protein [Gemmatimonadota bacterium]|nr:metallophosphatase family protein [Gemmatimonadota bacterium]MDH5759300.1 metallophosphatase family protein [Gemmatimonadota bacterium]